MFSAAIMVEPIFVSAGQELVITSGTDGKHGLHNATLHPAGLALDFRSRDLVAQSLQTVVVRARSALGPAYDVVLEKDHIHVEYQPKGDGR